MFYKLDENKNAVRCTSEEWSKIIKDIDARRVCFTRLDKYEVSTVFLGLDHGYGFHGKPILFETMVFGPALEQYQTRCENYSEAIGMHTEAVEWVMNKIKNDE